MIKKLLIILQRSNIPQKIIRFCASRQLDGIYDRDTAFDQNGALRIFDVNRPLIYATAAKVYHADIKAPMTS